MEPKNAKRYSQKPEALRKQSHRTRLSELKGQLELVTAARDRAEKQNESWRRVACGVIAWIKAHANEI